VSVMETVYLEEVCHLLIDFNVLFAINWALGQEVCSSR